MNHFSKRLLDLLAYIDEHLDADLSLELLSQRACLSAFHFHRQFAAVVGMTPKQYTRAKIFRRAAWQLAFRDKSITDIALDAGYESSEAFSRAFKDHCGQTPGEFRQQPQWQLWKDQDKHFHYLRTKQMQTTPNDFAVELIELPAIPLAALDHHGSEVQLQESIKTFIQWRRQHKLPPAASRSFNLWYQDPELHPDNFHLRLAAEIKPDYQEDLAPLKKMEIPAGLYARIIYIGPETGLRTPTRYLYEQWLMSTQYELRDFPLFFERIRGFPDVPEHQAETHIYLPLAV